MSDLIRDSFTRFYQSIDDSYQLLKANNTRIEDRKAKMLAVLQDGVKIPDMPKNTGEEYQEICREMLQTVGNQMKIWQELIQKQIERSEFVNRHEKSILALVFADVNAGKSSLGNFVGGWNLKDTPYADLYIPHECEIEDFSKASKEDRGTRKIEFFPENATEATSTIQHYTLQQGLTWVDTPGLHSLTTEHGDLAKEYIQFADLVVYLTPSSSPFKADERDMLGNLFRMGKPVILAITKSDIVDEDEIDGKVIYKRIPKSAHDRQAQENYVTEQTQEISGCNNLENSHVLSLSVMLARDAVKSQDQQIYEASNLPQFLSQMGTILSDKAIELKTRRPRNEVNSFINRLIGTDGAVVRDILTIAQLKAELGKRREALKGFFAVCKKDEPAICAAIEQMLPVSLSRLLSNLRDRKLLGDMETVSKEMSEDISKLVAEVCKGRLTEKLGNAVALAREVPVLFARADDGTPYQVQYQSQITTRQVERAPKGFLENLVHLVNKDAKFYKAINSTEKIPTGDNFSKFLDAQVESLRPEVRKHVSTVIDRMISACLDPLLDSYQQLDEQLDLLTTQLENLRFAEE